MKIIGWDIGIKNLSFCLLDTEPINNITNEVYKEYFEFNDNKYYLVDWKVLNLIPNLSRNENEIILKSRVVSPTCNYIAINKKGEEKKCNTKPKIVSWKTTDITTINFYCTRHKKHLFKDLSTDILNLTIFEDICHHSCNFLIDSCAYVYTLKSRTNSKVCHMHLMCCQRSSSSIPIEL